MRLAGHLVGVELCGALYRARLGLAEADVITAPCVTGGDLPIRLHALLRVSFPKDKIEVHGEAPAVGLRTTRQPTRA